MEVTIQLLIALCVLACVAAYVDVLVGGGGLITIPALLATGMSPIAALGTNKLQAVAGSGTATLKLARDKHFGFADIKWLMLASFIGSIAGTVVIQFIERGVLEYLIPAVIIFIAGYFLFVPKQSQATVTPKLSKQQYGVSAVPAIGFYDGMFGPATGSFFVLAGVSLRAQSIIKATIHAKTFNFSSNLASLLVFIYYGHVVWLIGLVMIIGQACGAWFGARTLVRIDPGRLRIMVVLMSLLVLAFWYLNRA